VTLTTTTIDAEAPAKPAARKTDTVVSVYVSIKRGSSADETRIHLKNLVQKARQALDTSGSEKDNGWSGLNEAESLTSPYGDLDPHSRGLAMFITKDEHRTYEATCPFEPECFVGGTPHVVPLLKAAFDQTTFYLLAVSQHNVRLFEGTRYGVEEVDLGALPRSVKEMFSSEGAPGLQYRSIGQGAGGFGKEAVYHGHASPERIESERLMKFLRSIDRRVSSLVSDTKAPLIFAGDAALLSNYRDVNSYSRLLDEFVRGNPDASSGDELRASARPVVQAHVDRQTERVADQVQEAAARGAGSTDLMVIVAAAAEGRVDTLLVVPDRTEKRQTSGREPDDTAAPELSGDDLKNLAVVSTLQHGGTVLPVSADHVPAAASGVAQFRY